MPLNFWASDQKRWKKSKNEWSGEWIGTTDLLGPEPCLPRRIRNLLLAQQISYVLRMVAHLEGLSERVQNRGKQCWAMLQCGRWAQNWAHPRAVGRYRCRNPACSGKIFCERLRRI